MFQQKNLKIIISKTLNIVLCCAIVTNCFAFSTIYAENFKDCGSEIYVFDKNSKYNLSDDNLEENHPRYGEFSISGDAQVGMWGGVSAYYVNSGVLSLYYNYSKDIDAVYENEWHIYKKKKKKVNNIDLNGKLGKGAIIV